MKFIAQVTLDLPAEVVELLGADTIAVGLSSKLEEALSTALPSYGQGFTVEVGTPESDAESVPERPAIRLPNRTAAPVSKPHTASTDGERRIGRPKTLDGYAASDGGPVREWGTRSPDELRKAGVKVYRPKGSGSQHAEPEVQESAPEPTVRKAAKKGTTPVVLRRR